jgi:hypothetical protein
MAFGTTPPGIAAVAMALPLELMTSDTDQRETISLRRPETFRSHLPAIAAATLGTVLAAVLGSLMGTAGTIAGMVIGSLASGTISWWAERGIRQSAAVAAARADVLRTRGHHPHPGGYAASQDAPGQDAPGQDAPGQEAPGQDAPGQDAPGQDAPGQDAPGQDATAPHAAAQATAAEAAVARPDPAHRKRRWAGPVALAAVAFIGCAVPVTLLERAAGKPLSAVVQGKPGHGTTLGGGTDGRSAPASPSPSPSPSTTGTNSTVPATSTAPGASSSPSVSPTPAASTPGGTSSATSTPPSATPTVTTPGP